MKETDKEVAALRAQLEDVQSRLQKLGATAMPEVSEEVRQYVDGASGALKEYIDKTATTVKEKWGTTKDMGVETGQKVSIYAHENPWHIAAAGALVGVVLASLMKREKE